MNRKKLERRNIFKREIIRIIRKNNFILFLYRKKNAIKYKFIVSRTIIANKTILFASYRGRSYSCSPKAIYRQILADPRFEDYKIVWAFRDPEMYVDHPDMKRADLVVYGSKDFYRYLARAKYWIVNIGIPEFVFVCPEQVYVQTWHGTPLKKLGCDLDVTSNALFTEKDIFKKYSQEGEIISYFISPSPFATEKFISAFNLAKLGREDVILESGYPRNDILINFVSSKVSRYKEKIGVPRDKKNILYAPTWRDDQHDEKLGYVYDIKADFDYLQKNLADDYIILFRAHYLVANDFDFKRYENFVYDVSDLDDVNDLYLISDLLVTDYSSVFFDYSNLDKPVIFYMYDLEQYRDKTRGFYLSLTELPGPIVESELDLVTEIKKAVLKDPKSDAQYQEFKEKFVPKDDGSASARVIEKVFFP
jgi:CDP-glycerol glycerophosphotransferase